MGLSPGWTCIKNALFAFNVVTLLCGAACLAVAVWAYTDDNFASFITSNVSESEASIEIIAQVQAASIVLMCGAALVTLASLCGCLGASKEHRGLLVAYAGVMLVLLIVIGGVGLYFLVDKEDAVAKMGSVVRDELSVEIAARNRGDMPEAGGFVSLLEMNFQCCGINGRGDYVKADMCRSTAGGNETGCVLPFVAYVEANLTTIGIVALALCWLLGLAVAVACFLQGHIGEGSTKVEPYD